MKNTSTKTQSHFLFILLAFVIQSLSVQSLHANNSAAAEATFDKGKENMATGNYDQACKDFENSQRLDPSVGTLLNLGECQIKQGKTASAWATFKESSVLAKRLGDQRRSEYAIQRANALKPKLTNLVVVKNPEQKDMTLSLSRAGKDMTFLIGTTFPIDPGPQSFVLSARGYNTQTFEKNVNGEGKTIEMILPLLIAVDALNLSKAPDSLDTNAPAPPVHDNSSQPLATPKTSSPKSSKKIFAYSAAGAGVASIAVGLYFGNVAKSNNNDSKQLCPDNICTDPAGVDFNNDAKSAATMSTVFTGIGGALLITGGVLWYLDKKDSRQNERSMTFAPTFTNDRFQVSLLGRF